MISHPLIEQSALNHSLILIAIKSKPSVDQLEARTFLFGRKIFQTATCRQSKFSASFCVQLERAIVLGQLVAAN